MDKNKQICNQINAGNHVDAASLIKSSMIEKLTTAIADKKVMIAREIK